MELTGALENIKIDALEGICRALPVGHINADADDRHYGAQFVLGSGFAVATPGAEGFKVVMKSSHVVSGLGVCQ